MNDAVLWLCLIHILICAVLGILMWRRVIRSGFRLFWIVALIPLWGLICLFLLERTLRKKDREGAEIGVEKLKMEDEIYRSILKEEGEREEGIVSFADATVINDAETRRELMMDILYSDASRYISLLKEARMDEDTEVVHYATTAMVELQKDYDQKLKEEEEAYEEDPENPDRMRSYIALLADYIGSGLLEGNMLLARRERYSELLGQYLSRFPDEKLFYQKKAYNDMALGRKKDVAECICILLARWPEDEDGYLLQITYDAEEKNRAGIDHTLRMIRRNGVFLTSNGKNIVRYWAGEEWDEGVESAT